MEPLDTPMDPLTSLDHDTWQVVANLVTLILNEKYPRLTHLLKIGLDRQIASVSFTFSIEDNKILDFPAVKVEVEALIDALVSIEPVTDPYRVYSDLLPLWHSGRLVMSTKSQKYPLVTSKYKVLLKYVLSRLTVKKKSRSIRFSISEDSVAQR